MYSIKKNFFILYIGQAVSQLTSSILQMAIVWYLILQGKSAFIIALSGIMGFLPQGIIGLFIGVYIDRHDRKKIMIFSDLMIALFSLLLVVQGVTNNISTELILFVLAMRSIGTAFHQPSLGAVIPLIVPDNELTKYTGYSQSLQSISLLISPAIAAALFAVWELPYIVFLDCLGAIFAVVCIQFTKIPKIKKQDLETPNFRLELFNAIKVLRKKSLLSFIFVGAIFSYVYTPIFVLYPMMSLNYFRKTQWHAGIIEIFFAVGMIVGSLILSRIKIKNNKGFLIGVSAMGISGSVLFSGILPQNYFILFVLFSIVLGFFTPFYQGLQTVVLQENISNVFLGRVLSLFSAITVVGTPIGIGISGIITDCIGIEKYFIISGFLLIAVSFMYFKVSQKGNY